MQLRSGKVVNKTDRETASAAKTLLSFCNKENFCVDSKYGGYNSFGTVYNYSYIISVQEILNNDHTAIYDKFGFERSTTQRIYRRYGAGSSLFA